MLRTFVAIPVQSKKIISALENIKTKLSNEKIKWVNPDNLHITLYFIGNIENNIIDKIRSNLNLINVSNISIEFTKLGFFTKGRYPRVLFVKTAPSKELQILYNEIKKSLLQTIDLSEESREYVPHLTLGRIKYINNLKRFHKIVDEFSDQFKTIYQVNEFVFYKSRLTPEGPIYEPLQVRKLI